MKKGQVYEATVERMDFPNKGIVCVGEDTVVVKNSLPGQKIRFSVNKVRNGKAEGRLLEVLEHSPLETGRPCSHFGVCGGCTYLSLTYEEQLKIKEEQVKRLLDTALNSQKEGWAWEGIKGSPTAYEYRNKMEFSFGDEVKDGPLALGMHRRGSFYDIVTVDDCCIVDVDYRLILQTVLSYFQGCGLEGDAAGDVQVCDNADIAEKAQICDDVCTTKDTKICDNVYTIQNAQVCGNVCDADDVHMTSKVRYYHRLRHEGYLRHLLVRKALRTGEILVALVTTSQDPWGRDTDKDSGGKIQAGSGSLSEQGLIEGFLQSLLDLQKSGRLKGTYAGILHIVNDTQADVVQCDRMDLLHGQEYFYEELLGLKFKISVFSFFQTNSRGAEVLYETVREYVGKLGELSTGGAGKVVFDLYSGTGTIAQLMAPVADKVIGVEIVEEAVAAATRNAEENGLGNCQFIAGDVLKVLDTIEDKPDLIILDPPRDGIHPKALPKIIAYGVRHIIYISCKPTSLVRDLGIFLDSGYVVERAAAVDQFPWTANIETVCLLTKHNADHHNAI